METASLCPNCGSTLIGDSVDGECPACHRSPSDRSTVGLRMSAESPAAEPFRSISMPPQVELLGVIGRGGMGVVYRARQVKLDRFVALKLIRPDVADDPAFAERFAREARMMARLNHRNIVAVHDFGESGDAYYLIMELVDGISLRGRLRQGPITVPESIGIILQVCESLTYAHKIGVIHRDVKPENILIDRDGVVKLADFGLAKLVRGDAADAHLTQTRQVLGTPRYMAPEQLDSPRGVDHRADIYAVGVVLFEMLVGTLPSGGSDLPSMVRAGVGRRLDEVVLRALRPDPFRRYQKAEDLRTDLVEILRGLTTEPEIPDMRDGLGSGSKGQVGWMPDAIGMLFGAIFVVQIPLITLITSAREVPPPLPDWVYPPGIITLVAATLILAMGLVAKIFEIWTLRKPRLATPKDVELAREEVRGPARGLIVVGLINSSLSMPIGLVAWYQLYHELSFQAGWPFVLAGGIGSIQGLFIVYAGLQMRAMESRPIAILGSLLALVPIGIGSFLGMGAGVWSLAVLNRRHVAASFRAVATDFEGSGLTSPDLE